MNKTVCVIGCGVICENHLKPLSEMANIRIGGVCDIIPERASRMGERYHCPAFTDYKEMLRTVKPDAVHLCLPHALHSPIAVDCMEMGADVLSEKPMDATYEAALRMKEASIKTGRKCGVIFQNRYNSGSVLAREALRSGRLGRMICASGLVMWHRDEAYYKDGEWRKNYATAGGGVIINQAIHTLDLIRWLANAEVSSVNATVSHHGETTAEVEDTSEGVIVFENGVKALYYFSINNAFDDSITVRVHCEKGDITIVGERCRITYSDGHEEADEAAENTFYGAKEVYGTSHAIQIAKFYEEGGEDAVRETMEEALKTQRLIHDIFESAGTFRA